MSELFNVVFAGELVAGAKLETVRANVGKLLGITNEATLDKVFSGQRVALKKMVDQPTAMRLRAGMKQAGANVSVEACDAQGKPLASSGGAATSAAPPRPSTPQPPSLQPPPAAPVKPAPTMAERIAAMAARIPDAPVENPIPPPAIVDKPITWKLFPVGFVLGDAKAEVKAPLLPNLAHMSVSRVGGELLKPDERAAMAPVPVVVPDLSSINVAPPGAPVLRAGERKEFVPADIDLSHLDMAPPNTDVLKEEEREVVVPVVVDLSGLSMAPPGGELGQIKEEKVPVNPDISKLKLA